MAQPRLRIYYGPAGDQATVTAVEDPPEQRVTVPLAEVFPLLADACRSDRTWLRDFAEDEITISADLYEILLAYQHLRRPSA